MKNIISLGTLEAAGYRVILDDATVKVMNGSMVVMRGVRENNLYYLKGKTITGGLAASITTDEDTTTLWHMRLGHTDDKSLQSLANQGLLKSAKTYKMELCKHYVLGRKTTVKFGTTIHNTREMELNASSYGTHGIRR
ncbi:uncharacterized protein LOC109846053 [Asparagus officinalis]|uniref:uncharacterized protein LOC109846053 n=1 Tax=Asparagus officinalis TaxID=4686 RepID=UPI00098DE2D2|nr:uncharacterized protein LOC109846053 [Asparagus officinalis]